MSISPFASAGANAAASVWRENSYLFALSPLSLSSMSFTMPMAVGPVIAPARMVVGSSAAAGVSVGCGSLFAQPVNRHASISTAKISDISLFIFSPRIFFEPFGIIDTDSSAVFHYSSALRKRVKSSVQRGA